MISDEIFLKSSRESVSVCVCECLSIVLLQHTVFVLILICNLDMLALFLINSHLFWSSVGVRFVQSPLADEDGGWEKQSRRHLLDAWGTFSTWRYFLPVLLSNNSGNSLLGSNRVRIQHVHLLTKKTSDAIMSFSNGDSPDDEVGGN